jgi:hypothetical protein
MASIACNRDCLPSGGAVRERLTCPSGTAIVDGAGWFLITALALLGGFVVPTAMAQTCVTNIPHIQGTWMTLPYQMPINPISATLLNTQQVLIVAGSENDAVITRTVQRAIAMPSGTRRARPGAASRFRISTMMSFAAGRPPFPTGVPWSSVELQTTHSRVTIAPPFSIPRPGSSCSPRAW